MFVVVKGNVGMVCLVMLFYESYGYCFCESVLYVLVESIDWFDCWVKLEENLMGEDEVE